VVIALRPDIHVPVAEYAHVLVAGHGEALFETLGEGLGFFGIFRTLGVLGDGRCIHFGILSPSSRRERCADEHEDDFEVLAVHVAVSVTCMDSLRQSSPLRSILWRAAQTPVSPGATIEFHVLDMYGRPLAQIWEQGMEKPEYLHLRIVQEREEYAILKKILTVAAVFFVAVGCSAGALGQQTGLSHAALQRWLDGYGAAWEQRDAAAASALFSEDAEYRETPYADAYRGRTGIAEYWAAVTADQREVEFTSRIIAIEGNTGVAEWSATFVNAASGDTVGLDGVFVLEFDARGLCAELREWWFLRPVE